MLNMRSLRLLSCVVAVGGFTGCQKQIGTDVEFTQVTPAEIAGLTGKRLELDGNHIILDENGTVTGEWSGSPVVGTWEMRDGLWCREYSEFNPASFVGVDECHLWAIDGNTIKAARDSGKGRKYEFKISE